MQTTLEFLAAVADKHHGASDYRVAKILGVTRATISGLKHGRSYLGDETALKVAAELGVEPGYVLACVYAERATRADAPEVRKAWEKLAARVAAAVVLGVGVGGLVAVLAPEVSPALLAVANLSGSSVLCKIEVCRNLIDFAPLFAALAVSGLTFFYLSRSKS